MFYAIRVLRIEQDIGVDREHVLFPLSRFDCTCVFVMVAYYHLWPFDVKDKCDTNFDRWLYT